MTDADELSFEEGMAELEAVVRHLEEGQSTLSEALTTFERGVRLLRHCDGLLTAAEQRVVNLVGTEAQGQPKTTLFDESDVMP